MTLKIAIVGCGKIADGHVEEIQKMAGQATVVAACDLEPLMAEQIAMRYGLPAYYKDVDRMLAREKPDVVHITTPPASHLFLARKAIDAGAHVFVEKPLTLSLADSKTLLEHATLAGKKVTVGYTYLFDPPALEMRDLIRKGLVGDVVHVESLFGYGLSGPFGKALLNDPNHWVHRLPGKLFHNNIDHLLNKLLEFVEDDTPELRAFGRKLRPGSFGDARDAMLDELRVMVVGAHTTCYATFSSHAKPTGHSLRVYGTKNTLLVDFAKNAVTLEAHTTLPSAIGRLVPAFDQGIRFLRAGNKNLGRFARSEFQFFSGLNRLFSMFYGSVRDGAELPISHRDMLRVSAMLDEIFRQVPQAEAASHAAVASRVD